MKNTNHPLYIPQSPKLRELLTRIDESYPSKENHPLYKMGFEAGSRMARENHRKLLQVLASM